MGENVFAWIQFLMLKIQKVFLRIKGTHQNELHVHYKEIMWFSSTELCSYLESTPFKSQTKPAVYLF
jgi:hypothetical protein